MKKLIKIKKNKKKKGFTLVELLATIALIGIVLLIGIVSLSKIKSKILERQYLSLVDGLYAAGNKYYSKTGESIVFIDDLVSTGYYGSDGDVIDPVNKNNMMNLFLNINNGEKNLYYCGKGSCDNIYEHNVNCDKKVNSENICIKDSYAYTSSIQIKGYKKNDDNNNNEVSNGAWVNYDVILTINNNNINKGDSTSKFSNNYSIINYTWYNKSNPNMPISSNETIEVSINDNEVLEDEYILYITLEKKGQDNKSELGNQRTITRIFNLKIDKKDPTLSINFYNEIGSSGELLYKGTSSKKDEGSGLEVDNSGNPEYYSCNDVNNCILFQINNINFDALSTYKDKYLLVKDKAGNYSDKVKVEYVDISCDDNYYYCDDNTNINDCNVIIDNKILCDFDEYTNNLLNDFRSKGYIVNKVDFYNTKEYYSNDGETGNIVCNTLVVFKYAIETYNVIYNYNNDLDKGCTSADSYSDKAISSTNETYSVKDLSIFGSNIPALYKIAGKCKKKSEFLFWENKNDKSLTYTLGDTIDFTSDVVKNSLNTINGTKTLELNAKWVKPSDKCTLRFDSKSSNTYNDVEGYLFGSYNLASLTVPSKTGYKFLYWKDKLGNTYQSNGKYTFYTNFWKWSCDDTLTAVYEQVEYSISYDLNGGNSNGNDFGIQTKKANESIKLRDAIPTKSGYNFTGWCTTKSCWKAFSDSYSAGATYTKNENLELYAQWAKKKKYNVTYYCNNGLDGCSNLPSKQEFYSGDNVTISDQIPSSDGYIFTGWVTKDNIMYMGNEIYNDSSNLNLYATWYDTRYTITYIDPFLTQSESKSISKGTCSTIKSGHNTSDGRYEFLYWLGTSEATAYSGQNIYFGGETYCSDEDLVLYAIYKKVKYNVYYFDTSISRTILSILGLTKSYCSSNCWYGKGKTGISVGTKFIIDHEPTPASSYEFTGYYSTTGTSGLRDGDSVNYTGSSDVYLIATYNGNQIVTEGEIEKEKEIEIEVKTTEELDKEKYKVEYYHDNSVVTTQYIGSGESSKTPNAPTKNDYKFEYWSCDNSVTYNSGESFQVYQDTKCDSYFTKSINYCKYDKRKGVASNPENTPIGYSYSLFSYNNNPTYGDDGKARGTQYDNLAHKCEDSSGNDISSNYKAAYDRKCNTDLCKEWGMLGWTAKQINDTYECKYHQYWCIKK